MAEQLTLIVRPGAVKPNDKSLARKAGIVIIEAADPSGVRVIKGFSEITATQLSQCVFQAVSEKAGDATKSRLADLITATVLANIKATP